MPGDRKGYVVCFDRSDRPARSPRGPMELRHLRYFRAVAESRGVPRGGPPATVVQPAESDGVRPRARAQRQTAGAKLSQHASNPGRRNLPVGAAAVPMAAIQRSPNGTFVYVVNQRHTVEARLVTSASRTAIGPRSSRASLAVRSWSSTAPIVSARATRSTRVCSAREPLAPLHPVPVATVHSGNAFHPSPRVTSTAVPPLGSRRRTNAKSR
jgi:hypothetical protein